jgi:hypothetical protein
MKKYIINSKQVKHNAIQAVTDIMGADGMEVIVQKHKHDKTAEQRGWFHMLCKLLGDEAGYTLGEVKELVKKELLGTKQITIGGVVKEVTESSEGQNRHGYSELIEGIYRIGAEAGIQLPAPQYRGQE